MKKKILVIAAHPDDEVFGCGGTLIKHKKNGDNINICFVGEGTTGRFNNLKDPSIKKHLALRTNSAKKTAKYLNCNELLFLDYPNMRLHMYEKIILVKKIIEIISKIKPDIIYTHCKSDLNSDHSIVHECVLTAIRPNQNFKPSEIYLFEIPSSTDWSLNEFGYFNPRMFVDIEKFQKEKIKLLKNYRSELRKFPFPLSIKFMDHYNSICGSAAGLKYAERFEVLRLIK